MSLTRTVPLVIALALGAPGAAHALSFNYSFSNDPSMGNFNGTVTGYIEGLLDNATSAATAVFVTGYPAGLNSFGSYSAPFDVLSWSGISVGENTFTVVGGVLTGGSFYVQNGNGFGDQLFINSTCCGGPGTNLFNIGNDIGDDLEKRFFVWNENGMGTNGVAFTAAVPEPETYAMMLAGLGLLGVVARRRKQKAAAA